MVRSSTWVTLRSYGTARIGSTVVGMGDIVEFPSNGNEASGYLALPEGGSGPGVIVVQEWWGLDSGIKEMAEGQIALTKVEAYRTAGDYLKKVRDVLVKKRMGAAKFDVEIVSITVKDVRINPAKE